MQARYGSSGDGFRSGYRNSNRGGFGRAHPRAYPSPQPPCKADIFMEAGRLAADYLVSKGLLPPSSLPVKPNNRFHEFKGQERELPVSEGRTSVLARLGNPATEVNQGRRLYDDGFNNLVPRGRLRDRRRNGPYGRGYNSEWGSREDGRRGPWMDRGRRYPDALEEGDDDFAPGYSRMRRGGFDEVGSSSISRVGPDEWHSNSEVTGESGTEVDAHEMAEDTGSKASSSSTRKNPLAEADVDGSKPADDDADILNSETGDEVKSDLMKNQQEEDMGIQASADEREPMTEYGGLLKSGCFAKVPTKPRSSMAQRSPKADQVPSDQVPNRLEADVGACGAIEGEEAVKGSADIVYTNQPDMSECQAPDVSSALPDQSMEDSVEPQHESRECPPGLGTSSSPVDLSDEGSFAQHIDKMEGIERPRDISPPKLPRENEYSLVEEVNQEKQMGENVAHFSKAEPEFSVKLEEEKQLSTFDLNLVGTPEITHIPDDPVMDHLQATGSTLQNEKVIPVDVGLSIGNHIIGTDDYNRDSVDDKVIQVINLEDDCPMEDDACDSSNLKNATMYSSLDNFLSHTAHTELDGIQDGYSLAFSEFLGNDISGCSSVPGDLNLQTQISLHDAQGVPCDDDSIFSLGEIGFMDSWDPPPPAYGNFFS